MDFVIEVIQLALIILIGVTFFNMSSMADQSKKHENIHAGITDVIMNMRAHMKQLQQRLITVHERFDNLDAKLSELDPNYSRDE